MERLGDNLKHPPAVMQVGGVSGSVCGAGIDFEGFATGSFVDLVRYAYNFTRDMADAEDLVQEALVRTYGHWATAMRSPQGYVRTVILNLVRDKARANSRRPGMLALEDHDNAVEDETEQVIRAEVVREGLRRLSPGQRAVLVLRFFEDLSIEQTATQLGCSRGTIKSQTSRGITALRRALDQGDDPAARAGARA